MFQRKYSSGVIALILLLSVFNIYTTCGKEELGPPLYRFIEKVDVAPARKAYSIGDTIWLTYNNPARTFTDESGGRVVSYDTARLHFQMAINNLYNTPVSAADGFFTVTGASAATNRSFSDTTSTGIGTSVGCQPAINYAFRVGIVPKFKGYYALSFSNQSSLIACSGRTADLRYSEISFRFNLADCNKDVFLNIPPDSRKDSKSMETAIDAKIAYVIQVK